MECQQTAVNSIHTKIIVPMMIFEYLFFISFIGSGAGPWPMDGDRVPPVSG
jgi:hypothetical protein